MIDLEMQKTERSHLGCSVRMLSIDARLTVRGIRNSIHAVVIPCHAMPKANAALMP